MVVRELSTDGRLTPAELLARWPSGAGPAPSLSTVRREVARVVASPVLSVRCEVSAPDAGWPLAGVLWCRLPAGRVGELAAGRWQDGTAFAAGLPEARACTVVAGSVNLHLTVWLRSMSHLQDVEARLAVLEPRLEVVDRSIVLSTPKRMGALLQGGRRTGAVPVDPLEGAGW